ncbi:MAG: hypothetical protein H0X29_11045 [Parachlamydiaceae bacterium]|nr:hypothetical protein [Parachlamydiaceae bacterium]
MTLNFPHNYGDESNFAPTTSHQNLEKLNTTLKIGSTLKLQDVVSKEALECFNFIKSNQNGYSYACKKYCAVLASFMAGTSLPFGAAGLTYIFRNEISGFATPLLTEHYSSLLLFGSVVAGVEATAQKCNVSLLKPLLNGVATGYALLVHTLVKGVIRYHDEDSAIKEKTNKVLHQENIKYLQAIYDGIADDLYKNFTSVVNNPKDLLDFKTETNKLLNANSQFINAFKEVKINGAKINDVDIQKILGKFKTTLELIRDEKIALRSDPKEEDIAYNMNLLLNFPIKTEYCIPAKVQKHIAAAKIYKLGVAHTAKHYLATAVSGALSFTAIPVVAFGSTLMCSEFAVPVLFNASNTSLSDSSVCTSTKGYMDSLNGSLRKSWTEYYFDVSILGIGLASLGISALIAKNVSKGYQKERVDSEHAVSELNKMARVELLNVYNTLAGHFRKEFNEARNDTSKLGNLKGEAEIISSKLNDIFQEIKNSGIEDLPPENVTAELATVLAEIITT